MRFSM